MTSGGRGGPRPDPNALRRQRDGGAWRKLPAAGRRGDPPPWPLSRPTARELALWADFWSKPQAVAWEASGEEYAVAMLVRTLRKAEAPDASTGVQTLARQYMEQLGLIGALTRDRKWTIEEPPAAAPAPARRPSARDRLKVVENG